MVSKRRRKSMILKSVNIFKGKSLDDIRITDHFLERWNKKISETKYISNDALESHIKDISMNSNTEHLFGIYI